MWSYKVERDSIYVHLNWFDGIGLCKCMHPYSYAFTYRVIYQNDNVSGRLKRHLMDWGRIYCTHILVIGDLSNFNFDRTILYNTNVSVVLHQEKMKNKSLHIFLYSQTNTIFQYLRTYHLPKVPWPNPLKRGHCLPKNKHPHAAPFRITIPPSLWF